MTQHTQHRQKIHRGMTLGMIKYNMVAVMIIEVVIEKTLQRPNIVG